MAMEVVSSEVIKIRPSPSQNRGNISSSSLVIPGQPITAEQGFLRGHGTYFVEGEGGPVLVASLAGQIERVNKLISVKPVSSRYVAETGDLVVGRITAVESKRWKCDINGQKDAVLQLASVNLPGGVQRMRTYEDQLQMRALYTECDLISAEVQNVNTDGTPSLHTRSLRYGKLENGQVFVVPSSLIKRLPQHYVTLPWGIDVLLGRNGYIWISRTIPEEWKLQEESSDEAVPLAESLQRLKMRHAETQMQPADLMRIARVRNSLDALCRVGALIYPDSIIHVYRKSEELGMSTKDMLMAPSILTLTEDLIDKGN